MDSINLAQLAIGIIKEIIERRRVFKDNQDNFLNLHKAILEVIDLLERLKSVKNNDVFIAPRARICVLIDAVAMYLRKLSHKNGIKLFIDGKHIRSDLEQFYDRLQVAKIDLNVGLSGQTLKEVSNLKSCFLNHLEIQAVVMEKDDELYDQLLKVDSHVTPQSSTAIREIRLQDLDNMQLIHTGNHGRKIFSASYKSAPVAVKQLEKIPSPEDLQNFRKEIRFACSIPMQYIVQVYGACTEPDHLAIVMELMKGNLNSLLQITGLAWDQKIEIAKQTTRGIEFLHTNKVLHRNISSHHVLYDENLKCKISDFSVSKYSFDQSSKTGSERKGTDAWVAPELFSVKPKYSFKSDVYALGVVLWEIATQEEPWKGKSNVDISTLVMKKEREKIPESTPREFAQLIEACWAHDPECRPSSGDIKEKLMEMQI